MRQSTAHLVVAFCSTIAISAAPLSPLPPVSPALISPMIIPRADAVQNFDRADSESSVQQKRNAGGSAYDDSDKNQIYSRDVDGSIIKGEIEQRDTSIQSDAGDDSGFESEADFKSSSVFDSDNESDGSDIEKRTVANPPSPQVTAEDFGEESGAASNDVYSAESNDDSFSIASDDEFSALASDDEESGYFENDAQSSQATSAPNSPIDDKKAEKIEKRGIDIGGESDRHGGRYYMSETKWNS